MANIEVYGTGGCPYCIRARSLLDGKGVRYNEIRVDKERGARIDMEKRANGRSSVPQIFIDDVHIGGYDDMAALDSSGKLDPLLGL